MLFVLSFFLMAPNEAVIRLDWPPSACPSRRALSEALRTYGLGVDPAAKVVIVGAANGGTGYRLMLTARGASSVRDVEVPNACNDRAAVIAVVIDALVAPYFWPAGKARPASEPTTQSVQTKSALDFLLAASEPVVVASAPASEPVSLPVLAPPSQPEVAAPPAPARGVVPMAVYAAAAPDFALAERTRGRFALGFAVGAPSFIRWFVELSFLTLRSAAYQTGRVDYGEGHAIIGGDVALIGGWFLGVGFGLQLLHAVASGFDTNRSATLVGPSVEMRTGYRRAFGDHFELGGQLVLRADLFRQRLLIDDVAIATLSPIHVGVALTAGVLF